MIKAIIKFIKQQPPFWPQLMGICVGLIFGAILYKYQLSGWYYLIAIFVGGFVVMLLNHFLAWLKPTKHKEKN